MKSLTLNTGTQMPQLGLGTWKSAPGEAGAAVEYALTQAGYRHVDCAAIYRNEKEIGEGFERVFGSGGTKREDVFITSKLWNTNHTRDRVRLGCERTLADLRLDYLDLYLMHWGVAIPKDTDPQEAEGIVVHAADKDGYLMTEKVSIRETWEAMEELVRAGLVKTIGVANFNGLMLNDILSYATIPPAVNQVELHPYLPQDTLVDYCQRNGIAVTAYSPLGSPGNFAGTSAPSLLKDETVTDIAVKHKKSPAQVLIRWALERDTIVIPKSVTLERIVENADVFGFALDAADMDAIAAIKERHRFVNPFIASKFPYFN